MQTMKGSIFERDHHIVWPYLYNDITGMGSLLPFAPSLILPGWFLLLVSSFSLGNTGFLQGLGWSGFHPLTPLCFAQSPEAARMSGYDPAYYLHKGIRVQFFGLCLKPFCLHNGRTVPKVQTVIYQDTARLLGYVFHI